MTYTKQTYEIKAPKPYLFIGSKVRGVLGYALKEEVCINPSYMCNGCFAYRECVFYKMYEQQNHIHNYRLDFKLRSKKFKFSILLFEELQNYAKPIEKAMKNALAHYKKVDYKEKIKKVKIKDEDASIFKITLQTPLRIKKQNRLAKKDIDLIDILLSIIKRHNTITNQNNVEIKLSENYKTISKHLYYQELIRRSNKQNTRMNLGGLMGEIIASNIDEQTYRLLKIGEIIGVGKSTVFGLGKIKIEGIG